jgi:hypothetical protein
MTQVRILESVCAKKLFFGALDVKELSCQIKRTHPLYASSPALLEVFYSNAFAHFSSGVSTAFFTAKILRYNDCL